MSAKSRYRQQISGRRSDDSLARSRARQVSRQQRSELQQSAPAISTAGTVADLFANARQRVNAVRGLIERVNGGPDWIERLHDRYRNPAGRVAAGDSPSSLSTHLAAIFNSKE